MNKATEEPRSRLRRLLNKADEYAAQLNVSASEAEGKQRGSLDSSPVRPPAPISPAPPSPLTPNAARASQTMQPTIGIEDRLQAEEALEKLRERTAEIANEFAEGKINRAQFSAMYGYQNERRVIIEQILARDPGSQAWQRVARPGHTGFLRQHYEARILSYSIYNYNVDIDEALITSQGSIPLTRDTVEKILSAMNVLIRDRGNPGTIRKPVNEGRWIAIVPGKYACAMALFSLEPSEQQIRRVEDIHKDFERANRIILDRGIRIPDQLVFPHRALFEKSSGTGPL